MCLTGTKSKERALDTELEGDLPIASRKIRAHRNRKKTKKQNATSKRWSLGESKMYSFSEGPPSFLSSCDCCYSRGSLSLLTPQIFCSSRRGRGRVCCLPPSRGSLLLFWSSFRCEKKRMCCIKLQKMSVPWMCASTPPPSSALSSPPLLSRPAYPSLAPCTQAPLACWIHIIITP